MAFKRPLHAVDSTEQDFCQDSGSAQPHQRLYPFRHFQSPNNNMNNNNNNQNQFSNLSYQQQQQHIQQQYQQPQIYTCNQEPTCHNQPPIFHSLESYEAHYDMYHAHACIECPATFPNEHYLSLHITEHHDPFMVLRRERGNKIYACLIKECGILCANPAERRMHMIQDHVFPKDYSFGVISKGIGEGQTSLLNSD